MSQVTDEINVDSFAEKIFTDFSRSMGTFFIVIGDELDLFKSLYDAGNVTVEEFTDITGFDFRYVREWLNGSYAAGYIEFDPVTQKYFLSEPAFEVLANEAGPYFLQGLFNQMFPLWFVLDEVKKAFRHGGGVGYEKYDERWWRGIERETIVTFRHALAGYVEGIPYIHDLLQNGGSVADLGSGRGQAIIELAKVYKNARLHGYDLHVDSVKIALQNAEHAGVKENTDFFALNLTTSELPETYDLITAFDVVHDLDDPKAVLERAYRGLNEGGVLLIRDFNPRENQEENAGLFPTALYGFSLMYCMTTALHSNSKGVGTMGLKSSLLQKIVHDIGYSKFQVLSLEEDDWVVVYKITK